jgi:putative glutamine amidotransferase
MRGAGWSGRKAERALLRVRTIVLFTLLAGASLLSFLAITACESAPTPPESGGKITVAVLYPSLETLKELMALRENGLIDVPGLSVIGVYHEKEQTDYGQAREFVRTNKLDWISFRSLSGTLSEDALFRKNSCSAEFEKIFQESQGIIFFGGPDIPPVLYGEKTSLLTIIEDPYRHFLELSFVFHLLGGFQDPSFRPLLQSRPQFPILGICLGCQSLNVGTGGTLVQDIWSEVYGENYVEDVIARGKEIWHSNPFKLLFPQEGLTSFVFHPIRLLGEGKFCREFGFAAADTPSVYSSHHQMTGNLGRGCRVIATSLDGKIIEALEHELYFNVLGVQFHPEATGLYSPTSRVRFTPQESESVSPRSFLEEHPPSLAFHQRLWSWASQKWAEKH